MMSPKSQRISPTRFLKDPPNVLAGIQSDTSPNESDAMSASLAALDSHRSSECDTTALCEEWSWTNGKFQCRKGQTILKEQSETPADVWVYCDQGWPGQEDMKKWRHWISATREILFS
jgi:hypothetical protein